MTQFRVVQILFLFIYINVFSLGFGNQNSNFTKEKNLIDSLYFGYNQLKDNEINAKIIIDAYGEINSKDSILSNNDLKILAISYSHLNQANISSDYLDKYIRSSHDRNILNNDSFDKIYESKAFQSVLYKYHPHINGWILFFFSSGLIGIFIAIVLNLRKKEIL